MPYSFRKKAFSLLSLLPLLLFTACGASNYAASSGQTNVTFPQTSTNTLLIGGSYFCPSQTFAICNKAICQKTQTTDQDGLVECSCDQITNGYTLSPLPCATLSNFSTATQLISTYTPSNTQGSYVYKCTDTAYADCYGAQCVKDENSITCTCPYFSEKLNDVVIITNTPSDDPATLCAQNIRSATAASSWGSPTLVEAGKQIGVDVISAPPISNP